MYDQCDWYVSFGTLSDLLGIDGTLDYALKVADRNCECSQDDIVLLNSNLKPVAVRRWFGCRDGIEECSNPIDYGTQGYYSDWEFDYK